MRPPSLRLTLRSPSPVPHPQVSVDTVTAALELLASDLPEPERPAMVARLRAILEEARARS